MTVVAASRMNLSVVVSCTQRGVVDYVHDYSVPLLVCGRADCKRRVG